MIDSEREFILGNGRTGIGDEVVGASDRISRLVWSWYVSHQIRCDGIDLGGRNYVSRELGTDILAWIGGIRCGAKRIVNGDDLSGRISRL